MPSPVRHTVILQQVREPGNGDWRSTGRPPVTDDHGREISGSREIDDHYPRPDLATARSLGVQPNRLSEFLQQPNDIPEGVADPNWMVSGRTGAAQALGFNRCPDST